MTDFGLGLRGWTIIVHRGVCDAHRRGGNGDRARRRSGTTLLALTRTAAPELGGADIRVNAVAVGTVRTAKTERQGASVDTRAERAAIPLRRRGTPDDVAGAVLYLLSDLPVS